MTTKYLSFSSPKGGVGRTLTLCNCAMIYAKGSSWAGIDPVIPILADLDFHAPGIHHYDFTILDKHNVAECFYAFGDQDCLTYEEMLVKLKSQRLGLLFLLTDIMNDPSFRKMSAALGKELKFNPKSAAHIYKEFNAFMAKLLSDDKYAPSRHLLKVHYEGRDIYIIPAASPNHDDFNQLVYNFDWSKFNENFGLFLLDGIFLKAAEEIKKTAPKNMAIRVLVDQQAGVSLPSVLNRSLADASVFVSGLNLQNKSGLEGMIDHYCRTYEKSPWVVLNQYKFRKIALQNSLNLDVYQTSPHEEFRALDKDARISFIDQLTENRQDLKKQIFLTEFINDAVQKEHFYSEKDLAVNELTRLITSIEKSFLQDAKPVQPKREKARIVIIGERVFADDTFSGPLNGIYQLLVNYFSADSTIIALAVTHEEIVELGDTSFLKGALTDVANLTGIEDLQTGIYNFCVDGDNGQLTLCLNDIDFISYPEHLRSSLLEANHIKSFSTADFIKALPISDSLKGTSMAYFRENINRWKEYVERPGSDRIDGIPLFVNFQLLAYRKNLVYDKKDFKTSYRKEFHRNFEGFRAPQDLIDFSKLTKDVKEFENVLLCNNPDNIAMWYEWQTIFSLFYDQGGKPPEIDSIAKYLDFLTTSEALEATLMYLKLLTKADLTSNEKPAESGYDWDHLLEEFYVNEKNGLIFIWPDAIPTRKYPDADEPNERSDNSVIYQVPPSFHLFEECWQISIVNKKRAATETSKLLKFLNYYLTAEAQEIYTHNGGLPIHQYVLSSLDLWNIYPFLPQIWSVYGDTYSDRILTKRDSFGKLYEAGKLINQCLTRAQQYKEVTKEILLDLLIEELGVLVKQEIAELT